MQSSIVSAYFFCQLLSGQWILNHGIFWHFTRRPSTRR